MRKDIITRLIGILTLLVSIPAYAYDFTESGLYYNLKSDGSLEVAGLASWTTMADILSDVTINGKTYRVTSIGEYAFEGRSDITYLSIPWSVTSIGEYAFIDCGSNLTVNIADPESWCKMQLGNEHSSPLSSARRVLVHDIETTNIVIPDGVTSIGNFTFYQCRSITSLIIPSSVSSIGSSAFEDCTGLTSISLSYGLSSIHGSAFEGCKNISSIIIPGSVKTIEINAFRNCINLNTITSEIQNPFAIDESVFSTYSTATLNVPRGTKNAYQSTAGWNRFSQITDGQNIIITANSYTREYGEENPIFNYTIDGGSISGTPDIQCDATLLSPVGIYPIKISKGSITNYNVEYVDGTLTITKAPLTITAKSYTRTEGEDNPTFEATYKGFKNGETENVLTKGPTLTINATIASKAGTYDINVSGAEAQNYTITYIKGTLTVTENNNPIFNIDGINYQGNKKSLTAEVKYVDNNLKRVIIPESVSNNGISYKVNSLGERSFEGRDDLTYLSVPSSIASIGEYAFIDCGSNIEVNFANLEAWCKITFGNEHSNPLSSAKALYISDTKVKEIIIPSNVTSIPNYAFYQCKSITSVSIPSSVTLIGSSAFEDCTGLTSVNLSRGLTMIGGSSFEGCIGLTTITIPHTVTNIEINAFKECSNLNDITSEILYPYEIDGNVFSTYSTATLKVPNGTKADYQATAGWNNFSKIVDGTESNEFKKDGITYETTSSGTIKVESVDKDLISIEIPSSVSYEGEIYTVSDINKHAFDGSHMAALIWNVDFALSSDVFDNMGIGSNFLLYLKSDSYAPSSVKNVIVDGNAQSILLSDDGGQFYCPQTFTARSISYTHNYSMETGGDGKGWETIALPFDVQRISHSTKGEIVPFASYNNSSSQKPFWLANYSGSSFRRTSAIKANEPYIIAMPNSSKYKSDYILAGDVSFSAENVQVTKTPSFSGTFVPTFAAVAKSSTVHALNVNNRYVKYSGSYEAGSRFISDLRDIRPFEAFISDSSTRGIIEINFDDNTTEINQILFSTNEEQKVIIHTLSGQKIDNLNLSNFEQHWNDLPKGVYIVNGKKLIK